MAYSSLLATRSVNLQCFPLGPFIVAHAWNCLVQGLANYTASHALTSALKALGTHDTGRLLKRILTGLSKELDGLEVARKAVTDSGVRTSPHLNNGHTRWPYRLQRTCPWEAPILRPLAHDVPWLAVCFRLRQGVLKIIAHEG